MKKVLVILVVVLLFTKFIDAVPIPSGVNELTDEEKLTLVEKDILTNYYIYVNEKYSELFKDVIKDVKSSSDDTLKMMIQPFEDYVSRTENLKSKSNEELEKLNNESSKLVYKYSRGVSLSSRFTDADRQLAIYLEKADIIQKEYDVLMKYLTSIEIFGNNARKYINSLSAEERNKHKNILLWYEYWQHETDYRMKGQLMLGFFQLDDKRETYRDRLVEFITKSCLFYLHTVVDMYKFHYNMIQYHIKADFPTPNESIQLQLNVFKNFIDRTEKANQLKEPKDFPELIKILSDGQAILAKYYAEGLNEDEKKIAKLLEEKGKIYFEMRLAIFTFGFNAQLTRKVANYLNSLNEEDTLKEGKLTKWLEDVYEETDYTKKSEKLLKVIENL